MLRRLQPVASAAVRPSASLLWSRPANVSANLGALSQVAFKATAARDPDRPKLPVGVYFRFLADYQAKNNLKGGKETVTKAAAAWKSASLVDKAPFERAYSQEREVYQKAFQQYKDSGKLEAWNRDPASPKRPTPPYFSWAMEKRKEPRFANVKPAEAAKLLKPEWDAMPASQKDALKSKFDADMDIFRKQKAAYDASAEKTAWLEKTGKMKDIKAAEAKKAKEVEKKAADKAKAAKTKAKEAEKKSQLAAKKAADKEKLAAKKCAEKEKKAAEKEKLAAKKAAAKAKQAAEKEKLAAKKAKAKLAATKTKATLAAKKTAAVKEKAKAKLAAAKTKATLAAKKTAVVKAKVSNKAAPAGKEPSDLH